MRKTRLLLICMLVPKRSVPLWRTGIYVFKLSGKIQACMSLEGEGDKGKHTTPAAAHSEQHLVSGSSPTSICWWEKTGDEDTGLRVPGSDSSPSTVSPSQEVEGMTKKRRSGSQEAGRGCIDPVKVPTLPQATQGEAQACSSTQPGSLPRWGHSMDPPQNCLLCLRKVQLPSSGLSMNLLQPWMISLCSPGWVKEIGNWI